MRHETSQTRITRLYHLSRRERLSLGWRRNAPIVIALALLITALSGALFLNLWHSAAMERDTAGRPIVLGDGTVTVVLPEQKDNTAYVVEMNIAGRQAWGHSTQPLTPGRPIWIRYCVGRSGTLYALTFGPH